MIVQDMDICLNISTKPVAKEVSKKVKKILLIYFNGIVLFK